ncbi:MAG: alpha/beta hydrolase [Parvibaculum sp.]|jgi:3-oxoadipate enol-lactonase|nr:alpha/beta hydrolase [Parvibaculum sp.]
MPHIQTARLRIYYEIKGSGDPVFFISGTGADLRNKPNFLDGPAPLQFETLAYDQRGLGQTDKPDQPYTMADYADDAVALLDALGWQQPNVIGVSFGGMVAQELALRHPDRINRLVLACTSPGGEGGASYPLHDVQDMDRVERAKFMIPISDTRRNAAWAAANPKEYDFFVEYASTDSYAGEPGRAMGATRQLEARKNHDTWDRLPGIKHPTLICGGVYDGIALPATQEKLAAQIPNAALAMFDGGHLFMIQDKTAVPAMLDFLNADKS